MQKREYTGPRKDFGDKGQRRERMNDKGIPYRKTPPPPRPPKQKIEITLQTEIPPMPQKHEMLNKPNWEKDYKKDYDTFEAEIQKVKNETGALHKKINNLFYGGDKKSKNAQLNENLQKARQYKNDIFEKFKVVKEEAHKYKEQYQELLASLERAREGLRFFSIEEIDDEIAYFF